jgi:phage baseplate assembly protein gpV
MVCKDLKKGITRMFSDDNISRLKFYSYATVAANKELSSDLIEAIPHEQSSYLDGELTDDITEKEGSGTDKDEASFDAKVKTTASIKAKWLSFTDTNRMTSPDVRRGEEVVIWRFADTDQYWWTTLHQDKTLRRLETVIYGFSNNSKENIENAHDSMYWLEISTHRKVVRFHTSKNDGEPFTYDIQLDTKKGNLTIEDDDGNYIFLDSKERHIKLRNKDNSYVEMNKKIINIHAVDEINLTTKKYSLKASDSITEETKTYKSKSSTWLHKTGKATVDSPNTDITGNLKIGRNLHVGGNQTTRGSSDNHHSH